MYRRGYSEWVIDMICKYTLLVEKKRLLVIIFLSPSRLTHWKYNDEHRRWSSHETYPKMCKFLFFWYFLVQLLLALFLLLKICLRCALWLAYMILSESSLAREVHAVPSILLPDRWYGELLGFCSSQRPSNSNLSRILWFYARCEAYFDQHDYHRSLHRIFEMTQVK